MKANKRGTPWLLSIGVAVLLVAAFAMLVLAATKPLTVLPTRIPAVAPQTPLAGSTDSNSPLQIATDAVESGYPGQSTQAPISPTPIKPTEALGDLPTAKPWLIPYSTDSTDKWETYVDQAMGLSIRIPMKEALQVINETGLKPAWKRIIVTIAVSNSGSGYADGQIYAEIHVRPNVDRLSLQDAIGGMSESYGKLEQVFPSQEPGKYPDYLVGATDYLLRASDGSAALLKDSSGAARILMVVNDQRIFVIGSGVDEGSSPTDLETRVFGLFVQSIEFVP